jgi:zinc protease
MQKLLIILMVLLSFNANAKTNYTKVTLDNGLKAYLIQDHRQPIAVSMVWYNIGSADEVAGKSGLAHLLEHLMFKGTDKIKPQEFSKTIAKLGGVDNASTSTDYTNYYQLINIKNLDKALSMEADRMQNLKLSETDFQTERDVVKQERVQRIDNSPWGRFYEKVMFGLYDKLPYKNITTGSMEDLNNLTREDALNWYKSYYTPNNATVVIVGDLTPEEFKKLINKNFANIASKNISKKTWPTEPLYKNSKSLEVADKQIKSSSYYKIFRTPSYFSGLAGQGVNKNDIYNLIALSDLLGNAQSGFLYKELVLNKNLANSVGLDYSPISKAETTFDISIQVKNNIKQKDVEQALDIAINNFIEQFNNQEKLESIKNRMKASQIYLKDDSMAYAQSIAKFITAGGTIEEYDSLFENIDNITINSIKEVTSKYLTGEQFLKAWLTPQPTKQANK